MTDDFLLLKILTMPLSAAVSRPFAWGCLWVMWYWLITGFINFINLVVMQEDRWGRLDHGKHVID